ncbi:MAG: helix-turn-helix domain-containing protein [archaeon]
MLEEFGFTISEEKVYLALVSLGAVGAVDVIKKTRLHRATVYDVLERLIGKGFVSFVVLGKTKVYSVGDSSKFLDVALEERKRAEVKEEKAVAVVKKLKTLEGKFGRGSVARVFIGVEGQKVVMNDIVEVGCDFVVFGSEGRFLEDLKDYTEQWARRREEKGIRARIVMAEGSRAPVWKLNKVRFVGREYCSPTSTFVYGNKVAMFMNDEALTVVVVESAGLAKSYLSYFGILWRLGTL